VSASANEFDAVDFFGIMFAWFLLSMVLWEFRPKECRIWVTRENLSPTTECLAESEALGEAPPCMFIRQCIRYRKPGQP
jgi:hypothetical protein